MTSRGRAACHVGRHHRRKRRLAASSPSSIDSTQACPHFANITRSSDSDQGSQKDESHGPHVTGAFIQDLVHSTRRSEPIEIAILVDRGHREQNHETSHSLPDHGVAIPRSKPLVGRCVHDPHPLDSQARDDTRVLFASSNRDAKTTRKRARRTEESDDNSSCQQPLVQRCALGRWG